MDSFSAQAQAQVQSRFDSASTSVKAQIQAHTGVDVNNQRIQQGATSAMSLMQNGYNPDSQQDNANLIHAISGGCALIPGGAIFGAYIELLWQVGNAIACPVQNAFASIGLGTPCGAPPCAHTGPDATASSVISANTLPSGWNTTGTFSSLVIGALATYAAKTLNCKGGAPPGVIVDACVAIWNKTHAGPAFSIWIPPLGADIGGMSTGALIAGQGVVAGGNSPSGQAGQDPNIFYAFQAVQAIQYSAGALAYPYSGGDTWTPFNIIGAPPGIAWTQPRVVSLNLGPIAAAEHPAVTVAKHASVIAIGGVAGGLAYAWMTGKAVEPVFMGAWNILSGWVTGGLTAVEHATGPLALGARENRRRGRRAAKKRK